MQSIDNSSVFFGGSYHIYRIRSRVDYWRTCDANLRNKIGTINISRRDGGHIRRVNETGTPEEIRRPGEASLIGIEGIDAVMFGGYKDNIVRAASHGEIGHIQRLGVDLPIDVVGNAFSELAHIHICCGQNGFIRIESRA